MLILVVEDNAALAANIGEYLEARGERVDYAYRGTAALELATRQAYDALVLDVALPGLDGLSLCRRLREDHGCTVPVLMLTARDTMADKLAGFDAGTDDYLTKPFDLIELYVRLQALVRRQQRAGHRLAVGELELDLAKHQAHRGGRRLELSPSGLRLLEVLMRRAPAAVPRAALEQALWGDEPPLGDGSLRVHLHQLRAAVDGGCSDKLIHTVRSFGYRLGADAAS